MKKFEVLEHTADIGIQAFGKDLNQVFENAAMGMFNIITDLDKVEKVGEYKIKTEAQDLEQLLVDWLSELLFIHTVKSVMFSDFSADVKEENGRWLLEGMASGENYDENKHPFHTEIKAVTHHILKIEKKEVWEVQVLFDI
jgi:SHS2 domain-containing protein